MPHKKRHAFAVVVPAWVGGLDSECLRQIVSEALWARQHAVDHGAEQHSPCRAALASADATMATIHDHRVVGDPACTKASAALRAYTVAAECAHPTTRHR